MSITDISMACGFSDCRYLNHVFIKQLGCMPKEYRAKKNTSTKPIEEKQSAENRRFLSISESLSVIGKIATDNPPPFQGLA
jgi:AraC-like DNA-binding protein